MPMKDHGDRLLLTTSDVARLLDVHSSTVKRWCDEGTLPSQRTRGGHRRVRLEDALAVAGKKELETFLDPFHPWEANVWIAMSEAQRHGTFQRLHQLSLGWLSRGQINLLGRLLFEIAHRSFLSFPAFLDGVIRGFMVKVGEAWEDGRLGVGEEHMATQVVSEVLIRLRRGWDEPGNSSPSMQESLPTAVVGAAEGDHHDLGAQGIRILLERAGWRVYYLGPNVPIEEFAQIQRAYGAELVCLSLSPRHTLPDLQRIVRVLSEFYRPEHPYSLVMGMDPAKLPLAEIPQGPFSAQVVSGSAQHFENWINAHAHGGDGLSPRRVA